MLLNGGRALPSRTHPPRAVRPLEPRTLGEHPTQEYADGDHAGDYLTHKNFKPCEEFRQGRWRGRGRAKGCDKPRRSIPRGFYRRVTPMGQARIGVQRRQHIGEARQKIRP